MLRRMTSVSTRFGRRRADPSPPRDPPLPDGHDHPLRRAAAHPLDPGQVIYVGYFRNFLLMASLPRDRRRHPLGPRPEAHPDLPVRPAPARRWSCSSPSSTSRSSSRRPMRSSSACRESTGADINFLVLPAMVMLATVIMAGLAIPLGGLLTSMPPLKAYGDRHPRVDDGCRRRSRSSRAAGTPPIVWFSVVAVLVSLMGLGVRTASVAPLVTAASLGAVLALVFVSTPSNQTWSPYYRIDEYRVAAASERSTSTASRTRRCGRSTS